MTCKNICETIGINIGGNYSRTKNIKRCIKCFKGFENVEGNKCPCCGGKIRTKTRCKNKWTVDRRVYI